MKLTPKLEEQLIRCSLCGFCRAVCPVFEVKERVASWNTRGRMLLLRALGEGQIGATDELIERIYTCALCGICEVTCPSGVEVTAIIEAARYALTKEERLPEALVDIGSTTEETRNIYGESNVKRKSWVPEDVEIPYGGDTLYYSGCVSAFRTTEIARSTVRVLRAADYEFGYLGKDECCCGGVALWAGYKEAFGRVAALNTKKFEEVGASRIVTGCPSCQSVFNKYYSLKNLEILHSSEVFEELIDVEKLALKRLEAKVTYHDPCHLGRRSEIYEAPRKVIESIPGVSFVEMADVKEKSLCCGGGAGVVWTAYPRLSLSIAERRLKEAKDIGAEVLVTSCPLCYITLDVCKKRKKIDIKILDLSQLLYRAISSFSRRNRF